VALKITLRKSLIGYEKDQRLTANALGLGRVGSTIVQPDNAAIRGMIRKITHVLNVETVDETLSAAKAE
jgi:large subunit ribosomal protein L30